MTEQTWILDPATGALIVEGLTSPEAQALAEDLAGAGEAVNCARPLASTRPAAVLDTSGASLRVARLYHGSVVDGPGRRSVVQLQGCPLRCPGCYVPETHDPTGGTPLPVPAVVAALLDPAGQPRDGVTVSGGEPFAQPAGLLALLEMLKAHGLHTAVYSGFTLAALARRPEPEVRAALRLTDLLIEGPFMAALAAGAGEWRGSRNQRLIADPAAMLAGDGVDWTRRMPQ